MPSFSFASSPSAVRAAIRVDKATSELLVGPDWSLNMEICDFCNSNTWHTKDVMKEIKKRMHHKNTKIQLLTLTLLEAMVKNCGDYIHKHISERKVLDEMIKIVKKKAEIHVRDRILVLLSSWQDAFGCAGGRYSQYYWACDELRRFGVIFPQCSNLSVPIITPPASHPPRSTQLDMPSSSSTRSDEGTSSEAEGLSESILGSMRNAVEVLDDMVQVMNPNDRMAAKEEVIVELVGRCRSNQKKLTQILTSTTDEDLLGRGLEMNEWLESVLTMYDAIASGGPIPKLSKNFSIREGTESKKSSLKIGEAKDKTCAQNGNGNGKSCSTSGALVTMDRGNPEEEHEDDFTQLVQRHSKASSQSGTTEDGASSSGSATCNALVVIDDPAPAPAPATDTSNAKEQEIIDLLSIVLATSEETTQPPDSASTEPPFKASFSTYVVPWAQSEAQQPLQPPNQIQTPTQNVQPLLLTPSYHQGYSQYPLPYTNYQTQHASNIYWYPTTTPAPINGSLVPMHGLWQSQNSSQFGNNVVYSTTQLRSIQRVNSFQNPMQAAQPVQLQASSCSEGTSLNGNVLVNNGSSIIPAGHKTCVPTYKLFEDLNVLKSEPYTSASGNQKQNVFNGRR